MAERERKENTNLYIPRRPGPGPDYFVREKKMGIITSGL